MSVKLVDALKETLEGWEKDLPKAWRAFLGSVELGYRACDGKLDLELWEPIFPSRRNATFLGEPEGTHILRAFDNINPKDIRCVLLGQDPYPAADFSTGRAFEAGNLAEWRELNKMFSKSVRVFMQQICEARTGNSDYAGSFDNWPRLLTDIEAKKFKLEAPNKIADHWVNQGVLLLNSSLTLSRFKVDIDPHQSQGHLPIWRPLIQTVLKRIKKSGRPTCFIGFGDAAIENFQMARVFGDGVIERAHPAYAEEVLAKENPFIACNQFLKSQNIETIAW